MIYVRSLTLREPVMLGTDFDGFLWLGFAFFYLSKVHNRIRRLLGCSKKFHDRSRHGEGGK